jgi:hypothetical protein
MFNKFISKNLQILYYGISIPNKVSFVLLCDALSRYLPDVSSSTLYNTVVRKGP